MKSSVVLGLISLAASVNAFPADVFEKVKNDPEIAARAAAILEGRQEGTGADAAAKIFEPVPTWSKTQYIDVSPGSGHEWQAPGPGDLRGPCPGLNAFANHGFLPHNGYATVAQFFLITQQVVGMGPGLAGFLAVYGGVIDGDQTAWSIGGTPPKSYVATPAPNGQLGNGLSGSHNKYESDASPMRPDLYQYGNDYKVRVQQFQQLVDMNVKNYDINVLTDFRAKRFQTQVAQNPYFFNGPFTGVLVQPAAYTFMYRFMANHTKQNTEGLLNLNVLKSWFAITGQSGSFKWTPGYERIPNNWYRRPEIYAYDQSYFVADVANAAAKYPFFLNIGGNLGKPSTFTGVDVANLSGGVFNGGDLSKNNNFACLAYQFAANAKPDVATNSLTRLQQVLGGLSGKLNCPNLENTDASQLMMFPGYNRSASGQ